MELDVSDGVAAGSVVMRWMGVKVRAAAAPQPDDGGAEIQPDGPSVLTFAASTETEDRSGDVVMAAGWDLEPFRRNPVFLWAHRHDEPPIGRVTEAWIDGKSLMATVEFAPTPFAQEVAALYRGGYLSGVSVGFRALALERRRASNGRTATLFVRQELLEISAAPVPLNAEALLSRADRNLGQGLVPCRDDGNVARGLVPRGGGDGNNVGARRAVPVGDFGVAAWAGLARIWQAVAEVV